MTTPIGKFRARMDTFLNMLDSWATLDQKRELEKFRRKYDLGMKANPRDSLCFFLDTLSPHAHPIMQGCDSYFLGDSISVEEEYSVLSTQLKSWWPVLDDEMKKYIKDQFKLLLMLGAIAVRHEPLRQIINMYRDPSNPLEF